MATQVKVFGQLGATGGPIAPGAVDGWSATFGGNADYGRSFWFEAHPLSGRPGTKQLEVRARRINESDGNRSFSCEVVNTGPSAAMYGLWVFWTDQP